MSRQVGQAVSEESLQLELGREGEVDGRPQHSLGTSTATGATHHVPPQRGLPEAVQMGSHVIGQRSGVEVPDCEVTVHGRAQIPPKPAEVEGSAEALEGAIEPERSRGQLAPPLKWAGGKTWLVARLRPLWEQHKQRRLVEPFVGGLGVTLGLMPDRALLNDANPHLINLYLQIQKGLQVTVEFENDKQTYLRHRDRFNELIAMGQEECEEAALLFWFLNRTGYNGLCRFDSRGHYNVGYGSCKHISYATTENFERYKSVLGGWEFTTGDFAQVRLDPEDFVYLDSPFDGGFTKYTSQGFTWHDQVRLAEWAAAHPGPVVVSNAATDRIKELYGDLGFSLTTISAPRRISCDGNRAPADEILAVKRIEGDIGGSGRLSARKERPAVKRPAARGADTSTSPGPTEGEASAEGGPEREVGAAEVGQEPTPQHAPAEGCAAPVPEAATFADTVTNHPLTVAKARALIHEDPALQVLPDLEPDQFRPLQHAIWAAGAILEPIHIDARGRIIDGRARWRIAQKLCIKNVPVVVHIGMTDEELKALARVLNACRRIITRRQRRLLIREQLLETPHLSNRRIASMLMACHRTVSRIRKDLERAHAIEPYEKTLGLDGKYRKEPSRPIVVTKASLRDKLLGVLGNLDDGIVDDVATSYLTDDLEQLVELCNMPPKMQIGVMKLHAATKMRDIGRLGRRVKREEDLAPYIARVHARGQFEPDSVEVADIRKLANDPGLPEGKVSLLVADLPWDEASSSLYGVVGTIGKRVLKPGGRLLAVIGIGQLPEAMRLLGKHLSYEWTLNEVNFASNQKAHGTHYINKCRMILVFRADGDDPITGMMPDGITTKKQKDADDWQMSEEGLARYIDFYALPGDLVMDLTSGSGTVAAVAKKRGRRCMAFDIDEEKVKLTLERLSGITWACDLPQVSSVEEAEGDVPQPTTVPAVSVSPSEDSRTPDAGWNINWVDTTNVAVGEPLTAVDLFCGLGGFYQGLEMAGFRTLLAIDSDPKAAAIYRANFPETKLLVSPIEALSDDEILDALGGATVDVLFGSPPCQGFSMAGKRAPEDPRNHLFRQFVRAAELLRPHFVVMENVPGLVTLKGGAFALQIVASLEEAGYPGASVVKLEAAEYGVSQLRTRLIIIASRHDLDNPYPLPMLSGPQFVTVGEAIGDLGHLGRDEALAHVWPKHRPDVAERLAALGPGDSAYDFRQSWQRIDPNRPAPTVIGSHGCSFSHPTLHRTLSVRELARLQGFPDEFDLSGPITTTMQAVANAVPPPLAKQIALALRPSLEVLRSQAAADETVPVSAAMEGR